MKYGYYPNNSVLILKIFKNLANDTKYTGEWFEVFLNLKRCTKVFITSCEYIKDALERDSFFWITTLSAEDNAS